MSTPNSRATDSPLDPNGTPHGDNSVNARPLGSTRNSSSDCADLGLIIAVQARDRLAWSLALPAGLALLAVVMSLRGDRKNVD
jgi:hypothetical protein